MRNITTSIPNKYTEFKDSIVKETKLKIIRNCLFFIDELNKGGNCIN